MKRIKLSVLALAALIGMLNVSVGSSSEANCAVLGVCCSDIEASDPACHVFSCGQPGSGKVSLTFDDGPDPELTPHILDILKENGVKATFFIVGKNAEKHPELIDRLIGEGHEVGNHTYNHKYLGHSGPKQTEAEISECDSRIFEHSEYCSRLFRPPGGIMNDNISKVCSAYGYNVLLWSIDTRDWSGRSTQGICQEVFDNIADGSVILMHDGVRGHTAEALEVIIPKLRSMGYEFVTASEMLYDQ